jgi:hypothetical protein
LPDEAAGARDKNCLRHVSVSDRLRMSEPKPSD